MFWFSLASWTPGSRNSCFFLERVISHCPSAKKCGCTLIAQQPRACWTGHNDSLYFCCVCAYRSQPEIVVGCLQLLRALTTAVSRGAPPAAAVVLFFFARDALVNCTVVARRLHLTSDRPQTKCATLCVTTSTHLRLKWPTSRLRPDRRTGGRDRRTRADG